MEKAAALSFLVRYQAMSDNEKASVISEYDAVRRHFLEHPDEECIPHFLNSFGDTRKCAFGVYQRIEDVIALFPKEKVLPHLIPALQSPSNDIRYWTAQIATRFPNPLLLAALESLARDEDSGIRFFGIVALEQIDDMRVPEIFRELSETERDPEIRELLTNAIAEYGADGDTCP